MSPRVAESMQWTDVGILGGGIVGSALACALASQPSTAHLSVTLLDGSDLSLERHSLPDQTFSNRVVSLTPSSQAFLQSVGIWNHLDAGRVFPYSQMTVWDGASGSGSLIFNASTLEGVPESIESLGCIVENVNLHLACLKRLKELGSVEVKDKVAVDEIARDSQSSWPILSSQTFDEPLGTSLLVGADGGMSKVRDFAKIASLGWDYQQKGLVATLKIPQEVENRTAYQRFLPTGPIAFLPV